VTLDGLDRSRQTKGRLREQPARKATQMQTLVYQAPDHMATMTQACKADMAVRELADMVARKRFNATSSLGLDMERRGLIIAYLEEMWHELDILQAEQAMNGRAS
jgi:hypothetical protein